MNIFVRLGLWLARLGGWKEPLYALWTLLPEDMLAEARLLIYKQEKTGLSGEYKRHQVYAALIKRFPKSSKRLISLAIEYALYMDKP